MAAGGKLYKAQQEQRLQRPLLKKHDFQSRKTVNEIAPRKKDTFLKGFVHLMVSIQTPWLLFLPRPPRKITVSKLFLWSDIQEEHQNAPLFSVFIILCYIFTLRFFPPSLSVGFQKGRWSHSGETACLCQGTISASIWDLKPSLEVHYLVTE